MPYPYDFDDLTAINNLATFYNGGDYDAGTNPGGFGHGGHRVNFIPSLRDVSTTAEAIADAAAAAETAADNASNYATALSATSTTAHTIGTGSKTFVTQAGKTFPVGAHVVIASAASPSNWMNGQVTAYAGTSLTVNSTVYEGSGSFNSWNIGLSAPPGPTGPTGATGPAGLAGLRFNFSTSTANADPGAGYARINNANPASATALYISETDRNAVNVESSLASWDDSTSTIKGRLIIVQSNDPTKFMSWNVSGTRTDSGTWNTFTLSDGQGVLPGNDAEIAILFIPKGDKGDTGATGAQGSEGGGIAIRYTFSTTTTDSDPGNGVLRLDSGTQNLATTIRADLLDTNGVDVTTILDTFNDSTTTAVFGQLRLFKTSDPTAYIIFNVTAVASPTGYRNITVVVLAASAANPFSDSDIISLAFTRTGDAGGGAANAITFTPAGDIAATNVQDALEELDTEKVSSNNSILIGTTDIQQAMKFSGDISPTQLTGDQNDYNPTGLANTSTIRLTSDASRSITGLAGGDDGRMMTLINVGSNNIVLVRESASSAAANRFAFPGTSNVTLAPDESIELNYDSTSQRWRSVGTMPDNFDLAASTATTAARLTNTTQIATTANVVANLKRPVVTKTGDYTVAAADLGSLILCNASLTLHLTAAVTLADGFWFEVANINSATSIVINPSGSETIEGLLEWWMPAGSRCTVVCNGTTFYVVGMTSIYGVGTVGEIKDYGGSGAPPGWLLCYGQAISRTTYARLFSIIGTVWGTGDGSTTFNVPDLRGRVIAGTDDMGGASAGRLSTIGGGSRGQSGGLQTHTLSIAELAAHAHNFSGTIDGSTQVSGSHQHVYVQPTGQTISDYNGSSFRYSVNTTQNNYTDSAGDHWHYVSGSCSGTTNNNGSGSAHNNVQPTSIMNKIIYTGV